MRSLEQIRAEHAYAAMSQAVPEVRERAIGLPAMLQANGLLATWAFCLSKGDKYRQILEALRSHLCAQGFPAIAGTPQETFRAWVAPSGLDGPGLQRLTAELLALAVWLKRAAEAHGA